MKHTRRLGFFLALILSVGALYLAFRHVPVKALLDYFRAIDYAWMPTAVLFCVAGFVLRALRWQVLLSHAVDIRFFSAFHPMMIGFMLNSILPGRVGELARPALFARKESFSFATTLSTIAAERVLDLGVLLALLTLVLSLMDMTGAGVHHFGTYTLSHDTLLAIANNMAWLCVLLVGLIICLQFRRLREKAKKLLRGLIRVLPGISPAFRQTLLTRFTPAAEKLLDQVASGFHGLRNPVKFASCLLISLAVWLMQVLCYWALARASSGIPDNLLHLTAVMVIVNFFIAIPSVPGFWGIWEAGAVFALALFGIRGPEAAGYALLSHVVLMFPVILMGLVSALVTGFQFSSASSRHPRIHGEETRSP